MSDIFAASVPPKEHNLPEDGTVAPLTELITGIKLEEHLRDEYAANVARAQALLDKAPTFLRITNEQECSDATEFMVKLRACWKTAEAARTAEKTPYDDAAGMVHAFFKTNILDPLGLAPTDKRAFDPVTRTDLGMGPRITMAMTIYQTDKMERERKAREEEARLAREAELAAQRQREAEERAARDAEDKRRREAEAAEAAAREAARQAELSASRKRNEESRAAAEAAAIEQRRLADEATARRLEEQRKADEERAVRDQANREAENKAAELRAAAEAAASASAADLTRTRGGRGGVSSLREYPDFRDIDRDKLDYAALGPYFTDKAIDVAVRSYMDANKATVNAGIKNNAQPLKGVVFYIAHKSASRA